MKKLFITTALAFSALAIASAQDASVTASVAPVETTGNVAVDAQVKTLRLEMAAKIKAIQEEYNAKVKLIVGDKKPVVTRPDGSTTTVKEMKKDLQVMKKNVQEVKKEVKKEMFKDIRQKASTTKPMSALFDMFKGYFGASVEAGQQ